MRIPTLTLFAVAALGYAAQAQDVPSVESVTEPVTDRAQNPDMDELPAVDDGTPDMNLPGMRTVDGDLDGDGVITDDTAPLDEGFAKDVEGDAPATYRIDEADANRDPDDADGYTPVVDEVEQGVETAVDKVGNAVDGMSDGDTDREAEDGRWTDGDDDGYTPVVDDVEQGVETAVKATDEALDTAVDEVRDVFDGDASQTTNEVDSAEAGLIGQQGNRVYDAATDAVDDVQIGEEGNQVYDAATDAVDDVQIGEEGNQVYDAAEEAVDDVQIGQEGNRVYDAAEDAGNAIDNTYDNVTGGDEDEEPNDPNR